MHCKPRAIYTCYFEVLGTSWFQGGFSHGNTHRCAVFCKGNLLQPQHFTKVRAPVHFSIVPRAWEVLGPAPRETKARVVFAPFRNS